MENGKRHPLTENYLRLQIAGGAAALLFSVYRLEAARLDFRFLLLVIITLTIGSRITVHIPRLKSHISVSDTFLLLAILLCGGEAAVLLAALDGFCSTLRIGKTKKTYLLNVSVMAASTFVTVWVMRLCFGPVESRLHEADARTLVLSLCLMGATQYVVNSGLVAAGLALKTGQPVWQTWRKYYLWTSITYFVGAAAAGLIIKLIAVAGFVAFVAAAPIIGVVYLTYQTYLRNIENVERHVAALQESEERFRSAFDYAAIGMALVSTEGRWLQVNRSLCEILGYTEAELLRMSFQEVTHPDDRATVLARVEQLLQGKVPTYQTEKRYFHKEGHAVWIFLSVSRVGDAEPGSARLIFQIQDITDRKRAEEQLLHDAFHDALTGLPNRALFVDRLKLTLARAKRLGAHQFAVLFLDLDRFKVINDSLGHMVGDQLLIGIARRLETCLRPGDTVARLGGDEFTILLEDIDDVKVALSVAKRVEKELSLPFNLGGHEVFTTVSIGIAPSTTGYDRPDDILRDADTAMYRAKSMGKSRHEVFDKEMHARAVNLLHLETDLRRALDRQEFAIHYQPIVALETGLVEGFEALLRWRHSEHGLIPPAEFIPVAEETGLIIPIGQWALQEACRQMREWQEQFPQARDLFISVNLSARQFSNPDLIEQIRQALRTTGLDPLSLKLEITESVVMDNIEQAIEMLNQLRALGVESSIDDFGTGYSSLSYLHRFSSSTLKVDRSFVSRMADHNENIEIVRTILLLARNLGMKVIAEGVETQEQLARLRALSCDYGQGYLFSKPANATTVTKLLSDAHGGPLRVAGREDHTTLHAVA
ncbi:MAG TPA: EAL domain-containing protein [Pyrinomonadaceae bacterium]|jgi:diguanylate cyclase (GGDEF)-like protein/PAS domain S-box-containing protein|nr:EAL domain-containing protein [Pyrinomonadaceae bacterium]